MGAQAPEARPVVIIIIMVTATAAVLALALLCLAAADEHARLISQSVSGTVHGTGDVGRGPSTLNGKRRLNVNVETGALRMDAHYSILIGGVLAVSEAGLIYDPATNDMTIWMTSPNHGTGATYRVRRPGPIDNGPEGVCHGPPVKCFQRLLEVFHYEGTRGGERIFVADYEEHGFHRHAEFDFSAHTGAIAEDHFSWKSPSTHFNVDFTATNTAIGAPSEAVFKVPAAWGPCERADLEEAVDKPMQLLLPLVHEEVLAAEAQATVATRPPVYFAACTGFALGALSVAAAALVAAALRRRRRGSQLLIEPLSA